MRFKYFSAFEKFLPGARNRRQYAAYFRSISAELPRSLGVTVHRLSPRIPCRSDEKGAWRPMPSQLLSKYFAARPLALVDGVRRATSIKSKKQTPSE